MKTIKKKCDGLWGKLVRVVGLGKKMRNKENEDEKKFNELYG